MGIVEELENSVDIVELVSRYVKLRKAGANFKAVCPFPGHSEKTPSFVVSPVKQLAYCFGCHKGGGALKFIMDIENCEFREAIQILGNITGKKVDGFNIDSKEYKIKKNIYSLYKDATNYYKKALENNIEPQKYLFDRGLSKETFKKFEFGFSDSGLSLYNYLKEKGYEDVLIKESNIFVDVNSRRDKFIGRIIFPIKNIRGDIVAFTARILNSGEPKYLNSPASKYYDKSQILYGLYEAKKSIVDKNFVIIVEGQMDAISMQEAGFINTVAISGTALTDKHLTIIKRLTHKIYLCFDGDQAGINATKLALENIKNKGFEIKIIDLPKGKDPDDLLKAEKDFNDFIENAKSPIAYYIKHSKFSLTSIEDKKKLLLELLDIVKFYSDPIEKDFYLKEISKYLEISDIVVWDAFKKINRRKIEFGKKKEKQNVKKEFTSEQIAIGYILLDEKYKNIFDEKLLFKDSISEDLKKILEKVGNLESFPLEKKDDYKAISMKVEIELEKDNEDNRKQDLDRLIKQINTSNYKKIVKDLKQKMQSGDEKAFLEYSEIIKIAKNNNLK